MLRRSLTLLTGVSWVIFGSQGALAQDLTSPSSGASQNSNAGLWAATILIVLAFGVWVIFKLRQAKERERVKNLMEK